MRSGKEIDSKSEVVFAKLYQQYKFNLQLTRSFEDLTRSTTLHACAIEVLFHLLTLYERIRFQLFIVINEKRRQEMSIWIVYVASVFHCSVGISVSVTI